jgi:hypothetical protein
MKHKTWKSGWVVLSGVLLLSIVQVGFVTPAAAVITTPYDWVNGAHIELADPATETPAGRDITKISYAVDASNNLNFKMDLSAVPTNPGTLQKYSYVFYIDALSPTAGSAVNAYKNQTKSGGLTGQADPPEFIIRYDIQNFFIGNTYTASIQKWNGSTTWTDQTSAAGLQWNGASTNGLVSGNSIEFQINNTLFNGVFNVWGGTITPTSGNNYATIVDDTGAMVTPIPSAAWLLGSGIVGLIGLKRRMARKA